MFKWIADLFRPEPTREITAVYVAGPSGPIKIWESGQPVSITRVRA